MKNFSLLLGAALLLAACSQNAGISGTVKDAPAKDLELRLLNVNSWKVLDTVKTNAKSAFRYTLKLQKGQPEFVYLFYGDRKIASLLLKAGDRVRLEADTLGNFSVEGSEDSELLRQTEQSFAAFASQMAALDAEGGRGADMAKLFIGHYREATRFVLEHPYSLVNVPVLYESINEYTPVFNQYTDAILFRGVTDSLKTVYPDSPYVKALEAETQRRENQMLLRQRLAGASEADYPELSLPGIDGKPVSLSGLGAKLTLLHFWDPSDAQQKMFNLDVLLPLYERWHPRGLEIYSVGVSADKPAWATVVKSQELPWINVCDGKGLYSGALVLYGVGELPWSAILGSDMGINPIKAGRELDKELEKRL